MSNQSFRLLPIVLLMPAGVVFAAETVLPITVVTASRISQPLSQVIGDISVIERAELERYSGESVLNALQLQAGIQIISNGGAGKLSSVFIRGANSSHTLVLIDGIRYGSATAGTPALEHLPVDQIERIEILRGSAASLYGSDAIGGVIQIFTRQGSQVPSATLTVGAGTENIQQASLNLGGQFGDTRAGLTLAHSKTDGISALSTYDDDDGYQNSSIGLNITHSPSKEIVFGLNGLMAQVENEYDSQFSDYAAYNDGYNGALNVWTRLQITPKIQSDFKVGQSIDDNDNHYAEGGISSYKTKQNSYQLQNTVDTDSLGQFVFGIERLEQEIESNDKFSKTERDSNSALFGYIKQYEGINVQANLRHDRHSQYSNETTYGVGLSAAVTEQLSVGAQHSTAFLIPSFNFLYGSFGSNDQLLPEESKSHELFIKLNVGGLNSKLTIYHNDITNMILSDKSTQYTPYNIDEARLQGLTLNNDWQLDNLQAGVSYDYLDAENRSSGATRGKQLRYRAKHSGVAHFGMQQDKLSGRVELQAIGTRYTDASNSQEVAGYTLVNLSGAMQLTPELKLGLRVNNLFDEQYESVKDYGTLGTNGLLSLTYTPKL